MTTTRTLLAGLIGLALLPTYAAAATYGCQYSQGVPGMLMVCNIDLDEPGDWYDASTSGPYGLDVKLISRTASAKVLLNIPATKQRGCQLGNFTPDGNVPLRVNFTGTCNNGQKASEIDWSDYTSHNPEFKMSSDCSKLDFCTWNQV